MIISHDYRYFDRFAGSFSTYSYEYVSPVKHSLDKTATEANILAFREHIYREVFEIEGLYIGGGLAKHVLIPKSIKYKKEARPFNSRGDMIREFPKGTDNFIGYLNAIKLRQLEQNPLCYPSGRPYIYPASVYKKHPDWP